MFVLWETYFVETGLDTGGIQTFTGKLVRVDEGDYYILIFEGGFTYFVSSKGKWTRRNKVYDSVDAKGQQIRITVADLIGSSPRGKKPGLELNVNWTRKGIAPSLKWRGLRNGNWRNGP